MGGAVSSLLHLVKWYVASVIYLQKSKARMKARKYIYPGLLPAYTCTEKTSVVVVEERGKWEGEIAPVFKL